MNLESKRIKYSRKRNRFSNDTEGRLEKLFEGNHNRNESKRNNRWTNTTNQKNHKGSNDSYNKKNYQKNCENQNINKNIFYEWQLQDLFTPKKPSEVNILEQKRTDSRIETPILDHLSGNIFFFNLYRGLYYDRLDHLILGDQLGYECLNGSIASRALQLNYSHKVFRNHSFSSCNEIANCMIDPSLKFVFFPLGFQQKLFKRKGNDKVTVNTYNTNIDDNSQRIYQYVESEPMGYELEMQNINSCEEITDYHWENNFLLISSIGNESNIQKWEIKENNNHNNIVMNSQEIKPKKLSIPLHSSSIFSFHKIYESDTIALGLEKSFKIFNRNKCIFSDYSPFQSDVTYIRFLIDSQNGLTILRRNGELSFFDLRNNYRIISNEQIDNYHENNIRSYRNKTNKYEKQSSNNACGMYFKKKWDHPAISFHQVPVNPHLFVVCFMDGSASLYDIRTLFNRSIIDIKQQNKLSLQYLKYRPTIQDSLFIYGDPIDHTLQVYDINKSQDPCIFETKFKERPCGWNLNLDSLNLMCITSDMMINHFYWDSRRENQDIFNNKL